VFTFVFGSLVGLIAGYFPWSDWMLMRIVDAAMALPSLMLALALVSIGGPGLQNVIIALGITYAPRLARVARSAVLSLRERTYVEAAKAIGVGNLRIVALHVFPNAISPILVQLTLTFASALLAEASLSFLGVGVPPYVPSWGSIIANGRAHMIRAPWLLVFPGVAIVLSVLSLNMMGDALRDVADPHIRKP
jgi:peptide/nickel transport system permease protein